MVDLKLYGATVIVVVTVTIKAPYTLRLPSAPSSSASLSPHRHTQT